MVRALADHPTAVLGMASGAAFQYAKREAMLIKATASTAATTRNGNRHWSASSRFRSGLRKGASPFPDVS